MKIKGPMKKIDCENKLLKTQAYGPKYAFPQKRGVPVFRSRSITHGQDQISDHENIIILCPHCVSIFHLCLGMPRSVTKEGCLSIF